MNLPNTIHIDIRNQADMDYLRKELFNKRAKDGSQDEDDWVTIILNMILELAIATGLIVIVRSFMDWGTEYIAAIYFLSVARTILKLGTRWYRLSKAAR